MLTDLLDSILGVYTPTTVLVDSANSVYEVVPDWSYIGSFLLLAIMLYCFFRILGGIIVGK